MTSSSERVNHAINIYRPDIDGLRAIAVLLVVLFHAFPTKLPGGFVGVDIFFVISGFLISSIVTEKVRGGEFTFSGFYVKRALRIFPALVIVLATIWIIGWFKFYSDEYVMYGIHMKYSSLFASNLASLRENGYFDSVADLKPLLHLWSLAIEEQFYLVWPVMIVVAFRLKIRLELVLGIAIIGSLGYCVFETQRDAAAAFYLPFSRAWELLIGAALAASVGNRFYMRLEMAATLSICGALLLIAAVILIDPQSAFPGYWAILPTIGAALIIAGGPAAPFNRKVLSAKPMIWIGLISYPLYLWHWPILSVGRILNAGPLGRAERILAVGLAFALAWATYRFIERPIRFGGKAKQKSIALAGCLLTAGIVGDLTQIENGIQGFGVRTPAREAFLSAFDDSLPAWRLHVEGGINRLYRVDCGFYDLEAWRTGAATQRPLASISESCVKRDFNKPHAVFIWGDSHAQQLNWGISQTLPSTWQVMQVASSDCPPSIDVKGPSDSNYCIESNWTALQAIRTDHPEVVVVAQRDHHRAADMRAIERLLVSIGVQKVIFTGPTPRWTADLPKIILRKLGLQPPVRTLIGLDPEVLHLNIALRAAFTDDEHARFADLIGALCDAQGCLTRVGPNIISDITSYDYGHLTPHASRFVAAHLLESMVVDFNK